MLQALLPLDTSHFTPSKLLLFKNFIILSSYGVSKIKIDRSIDRYSALKLPSQTGVGESHFPSLHWLNDDPRRTNPLSHQNCTLLRCWRLSPNTLPFVGIVGGGHGAEGNEPKKRELISDVLGV